MIFTTCVDKIEAEKIATALLEKRLVACIKSVDRVPRA
jgi:uncharacterized protein involved in tolerance to divalent cations